MGRTKQTSTLQRSLKKISKSRNFCEAIAEPLHCKQRRAKRALSQPGIGPLAPRATSFVKWTCYAHKHVGHLGKLKKFVVQNTLVLLYYVTSSQSTRLITNRVLKRSVLSNWKYASVDQFLGWHAYNSSKPVGKNYYS